MAIPVVRDGTELGLQTASLTLPPIPCVKTASQHGEAPTYSAGASEETGVAGYSTVSVPFMSGWTSQMKGYVAAPSAGTW